MLINKEKNRKLTLFFGIALVIFFVICTELFRRMTLINPPLFFDVYDYLDPRFVTYYSDIRLRLSMPRGDSYSLFLVPEFIFCDGLGEPVGAWCNAIYLSFFTVGTIPLVYLLLKKLCPNARKGLLVCGSFASMFVIPIYILLLDSYGGKLYGTYLGSVWHNETSIGMRFFALLVLLFFYDTCDRYLDRFSIKEFFISCLLFSAVNIVKPSFIIAFAPAMLVMMIIDIIIAKGKGFAKWILYGLPVLIGSVVLIYQYFNLFPNTDSADSSHVIVVFGDAIRQQRFPVIEFLRSYAFPIFIFILHRKELMKSKFHLICLLSWLFSFLDFFLLSESGPRSHHGNFTWGIRFFTFLVFCLSIGYFVNDVNNAISKTNMNRKAKLELCLGSILIFLHLISGIYYFIDILLGFCAYVI